MSMNQLNSLRHPPEAVVSFVRCVIDGYRTQHVEAERRTQPRQCIAVPVAVQPLDSDFQPAGEVFAAVTKDISSGGIGIIHKEPVAAPYIHATIVARDGQKMSLLAQVKHCTLQEDCYLVGARFVVDWSQWRSRDPQNRQNLDEVEDSSAMPSEDQQEETR